MAEFARQSILTILRQAKKLLPNKRVRIFAVISIFVALLLSFAFVEYSFALGVESIIDAGIRLITWIIMQIAIIFIQITIFFLRYFILIAGYNDFINAYVVELGWNMVRDVTNMFFIVILMVIAFGTILGLDQYEWRKTLVKLLMVALLVNFSNTIIQLMIDVVHVFTATFLNAVAGAAGGNLINMFNYDKLFSIVGKNPEFFGGNDLILEFFASGVLSAVFAGTSMMTMGAYVVIMLARVVTLWVAMILSPLMFLMSVLPQTKKYADEYWGQVTNSLLAAPVMVFFLWLAFATFGGGQSTVEHFGENQAESRRIGQQNVEALGQQAAVGLSRAATWDNMANFAVAIAFLWIGLDQVRKLGVPGASLTQNAQKFGMAVATIASGYAAGRFLYEGGKEVGKEFGKDYGKLLWGKTGDRVLYKVPLIGGKGKDQRKAALERLEKIQSLRTQQTKANGGGMTERLRLKPSADRLGNQILDTENAEATSEGKKNQLIAGLKSERLQREKTTFEDRKEELFRGRTRSSMSSEEIYDLEMKAAKGLSSFEAHLSKELGDDQTVEVEGKYAETMGLITLNHLKDEMKQYLEMVESVRENLINNKISSLSTAEKEAELGLSPGSYTPGTHDAQLRAHMTKKITDTEVAKAAEAEGVTEGLVKFSGMRAKLRASQKTGKYKGLTEDMSANVSDLLRAYEGKRPDEVLNREMGKINEELREYSNSTFPELFSEIEENYDVIKVLRSKEVSGTITGDEKTELKNRQQSQARAVASAQHHGWGHVLAGTLARKNSTYASVDLNDADNMHMRLLGLIETADYGELDSDTKASNVQEKVRTRLKDKAGIIFRTLQTAVNESADKHGHLEDYAQMGTGIDANGNKVIGFLNAMKAEVGSRNQLGTGSSDAGAVLRKAGFDGDVAPGFTIHTSKNARSYVQSEYDASGNEIVTGIRPEAKEAVLAITQLSADQILRLETPVLNMLSGGTYAESSWDAGRNTWKTDASAVRMKGEFLDEVRDQLLANFTNPSVTPNEQQIILKKARSFYKQLGVKGVQSMDFSTLMRLVS